MPPAFTESCLTSLGNYSQLAETALQKYALYNQPLFFSPHLLKSCLTILTLIRGGGGEEPTPSPCAARPWLPSAYFYAQCHDERLDVSVRSAGLPLPLFAAGHGVDVRADSAPHQRQPRADRGDQRGLGEMFQHGSLLRRGRQEVHQSVGDTQEGEKCLVAGRRGSVSGNCVV